jgi:hypothetical protein
MTNRPGLLSVALGLCGCLAFVASGTSIGLTAQAADKAKASTPHSKPKAAAGKSVAASTAQAKASKPAAAAYDGPPVLDPSRFFGAAQMGYASAKAAPEVISHLFCYCGCDATEGHHNLIDCYTGMHGTDCHICQEEAVEALKLSRDHKSIAEIQKQIDQDFSNQYPFTQPTANFKAYKASRLYTPAPDTNTQAAGPEPAPDDKAPKEATAPKVKPGFHVGACCSEGEKK